MIEDEFLPYFIHEELYILETKDEKQPSPVQPSPAQENVPPVLPKKEEKIHPFAIWTPPLSTIDKELLSKILGAINIKLEDVYLMEGINGYTPNYETLICFGYQKELELKLGAEIPQYTPKKVLTHQLLTSAPPESLHEDKHQKTLLWQALKKMFL